MEPESSNLTGGRTGRWLTLALCAAVLAGWVVEHLVPNRPDYGGVFAPDWLPLAAAATAAAGIMLSDGRSRWLPWQRALSWSSFLLMVWAANGLPLDLLRAAGLIPLGVDWAGLATRTLALAATIMLGRRLLASPAASAARRPASWYGYAAFVCALPYPVLRTHWLLGGTLGLMWPGAAGRGIGPWLISIPFVLAAALSLLLVSPRRWLPRRLLLAAGWSGTAIVGMVGPSAFWALLSALARGREFGLNGIAAWVPALFYSSWFLWAVAAGAATRSYQLRSAVQHTLPAA